MDRPLRRRTPMRFANRCPRRRSSPAARIPLAAQLETRLFEKNRALEAQAREHNLELARLNIELALEIAQHKQAEESATASEERFHSMADHVQEGLTILEDGQTVYVNNRVCEIFGDCPEQDLRRRIEQFAVPHQKSGLLQQAAALAQAGEAFELEYWILRPDGTQRCIREMYSTSRARSVER
ncbi:MAG: PAS domain-containing protein, partial [Chloroflexota bacterium]